MRNIVFVGCSWNDWPTCEFCERHSPGRHKFEIPNMAKATEFVIATPVLASLDIKRSVEFFCSKLGFTRIHEEQGTYGIVSSGSVSIHFWC